ncbi:MAG TPA: VOC family protein [Pyrinomonadaceae bacterium]|nr:VOC family protein [Pyrinomonadaceae bacterium]
MTEARMQETTDFKPGTFCWVELATTDANAAKSFYSQLFEWTFKDNPVSPEMVYTMVQLDGKDVGGLYQMTPDMTGQGIPPNWLSYVSVKSADETTEKAKTDGATVLNGPFDVFTIGRMSVIKDPAGAVFALWQPGTHKGAGIYNVPNTFCWNELATRDTEKAGDFYSSVFGWNKNTKQFGPMEYTIFENEGRGNGGMFAITPEMGNLPPHWLTYFAVDDCDAKVRKATELGARVMKPADDIPGVGRFAILLDPPGAAFAIIKLESPQP